jgi:ATP-dependent 26S proteasome regulatory subunit
MPLDIQIPADLEERLLTTARSGDEVSLVSAGLPNEANFSLSLGGYQIRQTGRVGTNGYFNVKPIKEGEGYPSKETWGNIDFGGYSGNSSGLGGVLEEIFEEGELLSSRETTRDNKIRYGTNSPELLTSAFFNVDAISMTSPKSIEILLRGITQNEGVSTESRTQFMKSLRWGIKQISDILDKVYEKAGLTLGNIPLHVSLPDHRSMRIGHDHVDMVSLRRMLEVRRKPIRFADIVGLRDAKEDISEFAFAVSQGAYQRLGLCGPSGVLLHGPPGNGKTYLARAVATESNMRFLNVPIRALMSSYTGRPQMLLAAIGDLIKGDPTIVYFDEVDAIARDREDARGERKELIATLLSMMDGMDEQRSPVLYMGSTNRIQGVDPAFLRAGRFTLHYEVKNPNREERIALLDKYLQTHQLNLAAQITGIKVYDPGSIEFDAIATMTGGNSAAYIAEVTNRAVEKKYVFSLARSGSVSDSPLTTQDIIQAHEWLKGRRAEPTQRRTISGFNQ